MIHILPLHIDGACDLETGDIFISSRLWGKREFYDNIIHEAAHMFTGSPLHNRAWRNEYHRLGGSCHLYTAETGSCFPMCFNIGNISGIQNILTDYHLLQAYRKFSQKVLGTEGHWEVINEGTSNVGGDSLSAKDQLIRLYPTPKGAFPVVVLYIPVVNHFRSAQARQITYDLMEAEAKIAVGMARRKIQGMPTPSGGTITYDGSELINEGEKAKDEIIDRAIKLGEPLGIFLW